MSPRRVTVVAAAVAVGFVLEWTAIVEDAVLPALLIGLVVSMFVPAKGGCPVDLAAARSRRNAPDGGG